MAKKKEENANSGLSPLEILKRASKNGGLGQCVPSRPKLSTGSLALDLKLGGGVASDRIVEWYGKTGSFKTSMALMTLLSHISLFPDDKRPRLIVDLERTITENHLRNFGIDPSTIWIEKPTTAEETMNFISDAIHSGAVSWVLLDSIDAMESEEDTKKSYGESSMMKLAKLLSEAMRDLSKAVVDNNVSLQLINQIRAGSNGYQMVETTSGGAAIPYYASQRMKAKKESKAANNPMAAIISVEIRKNKMFPTIAAESQFEFIPSKGIDVASDRLAAGLQLGAIQQGGAYYSIMNNGELLYKAKGAKDFAGWLSENQTMFDSMLRKINEGFVSELATDEQVPSDENEY